MYRRSASRSSSDQERCEATRSPAADPPSDPVTTTRSPGRAPSRRTARPGTDLAGDGHDDRHLVTAREVPAHQRERELVAAFAHASGELHDPARRRSRSGSVSAQSANRGLAAIAATSLTFTAIAL